METVTGAQEQIGERINKIIANFGKDSAERKTQQYLEVRLQQLETAWSEFESNHARICELPDATPDHEYFQSGYYEKIRTYVLRYQRIFIDALENVAQSAKVNVPAIQGATSGDGVNRQGEKKRALATQDVRKLGPSDNTTRNENGTRGTNDSYPSVSPRNIGHTNEVSTAKDTRSDSSNPEVTASPSIDGLIRRQNAIIEALRRTIRKAMVELPLAQTTSAGYVATIDRLWNQVEAINYSIWEQEVNPDEAGYDTKGYIEIEGWVQTARVEIQGRCTNSNLSLPNSNSINLPKVAIPKFGGDCMQWQQFHDIFLKMIDMQPLAAIQKMWYLKASLYGEAEMLIKHLDLTEQNYEAAWNILKDRYSNIRKRSSALIQRILDIPDTNQEASSVKQLHDVSRECLVALNNIGIETESWDPLLLHLLIKKMDRQTHILYEQQIKTPKEIPSIKEFLAFLQLRFETLEAVNVKNKNGLQKTPVHTHKVASVHTVTASTNKCAHCSDGSHPLYFCNKFVQLKPADRLAWVQRQGLCFNCFKKDHDARKCVARHCTKCDKKHNTLLHLEEDQSKTNKAHTSATTTLSAASTRPRPQNYTLLATARVQITAANGQVCEVRAMLDSGSQVNLITERVVKRLGLTTSTASLDISGIGNRKQRATQRLNVQLDAGEAKLRLEAYVLSTIVPHQPTIKLDTLQWAIPNNIKLADPLFNCPGRIDVLLGAEIYFQVIQAGHITLADNLPILQNTTLGWVVGGRVGDHANTTSSTCAIATGDDTTSELLEKFWKLDAHDEPSTQLSVAERKCEEHFNQTTTTDSKGRMIVRLPFRENPATLGHSQEIAQNRFNALERRLDRNPELKSQYAAFMDQYLVLGHMEEISPDKIKQPHYFIPHHCVIKPDSTTTKLRVVFDASAKTTSGLSLNDIMYTGPVVQTELFSILLRFRLPRFAFTTDIEKMYRQIWIEPTDRMVQLIIWRRDSHEPKKYYQLKTVTYGTSSAPYLATKCLQHLAEKNMQNYPLGAEVLHNDFYVDDGVSGADSLCQALETQKQLVRLLGSAGFKLRKWCANHPQLLQGIPPEDQEVNLDFENTKVKILGLCWTPKSDEFRIKVDLGENVVMSKRSICSDVAKIFDPLGLLGPVVIVAKILLQQLWLIKVDWDDTLPNDVVATWSSFRQGLQKLNELKIRRHIFDHQKTSNTEIHTFVDASEKAYGAAVYLRSKHADGRVTINLLCAKSRVAPLMKQTLPRLELCAAVLGAELTKRVIKDLRFSNKRSFLWSDSEIVLSWICSPSASFHTFVANRVAKIQNCTIPQQWRHVSSKDNPADIISRGIQPDKLASCTPWFFGPIFLHGKESQWPQPFAQSQLQDNDLERKQKKVVTVAVTSTLDNVYTIRHSNSFRKLQRIFAYVLRFIRNTRDNKNHPITQGALTTEELDAALNQIIRDIQKADFATEISQIHRHSGLDKSSAISSLAPFMDQKGILRVGGRLEASSLSFDAKHPMLLPYNDPLVKLLLKMLHEDHMHCGPQTLLAASRQRFWIIKGKTLARNIVQNCVRCTRAKPRLYQQVMGNLPAFRVTQARPFLHSGVDYCGPFCVHYKIRGKKPQKACIAVFCCFTTKALHLELVSDLTSDAFLGALKRFISRRGKCTTIHCDNATNFVGARNQLQELDAAIFSATAREKIVTTCSHKGVEFKFIPPRAPHFGGLWEAAVKSAKHLLMRSVSTASLTYEELETVVIEIEAILNSRPLTPLSNDPNDISALTPGHFLIGEPLTAIADKKPVKEGTSLGQRWQLVSQLKHAFWRQWSRDYLHQLQHRRKWKTESNNVEIGTLVILQEDNTPVLQWPLGRITQVYHGDDGAVRVVDVKTATGTLKREIHRLAPLFPEEKKPELSRSNDDSKLPELNNDEDRPPAKRGRPSSLLLTCLVALCILPAVIGDQIKITNYSSNPGIYFEGIGSASLVNAEWKIIAYYHLAPLWTELDAFRQGISALTQLCSTQHEIKTHCHSFISYLQHEELELQHNNQMLAGGRTKRAALDIIGNIAHSLFGVLDSNYAEDMSNTIGLLKTDDNHLLRLLHNHTSVIDTTINIIKRDEVATNARILQLQEQLNTIMQWNNNVREQLQGDLLFSMISTQLAMMSDNIRRIQTEIVDVLTDAHHGKINPLLVSPQQLLTELRNIRGHLPKSRALPFDRANLNQAYKILTAEGAVTRDYVVFIIKVPLVDDEALEIYKLTPIPTTRNGQLLSIQPSTDYLAINAHRDHYIALSATELASCSSISIDNYVCPDQPSKFGKAATAYACELQLFLKNSSTVCRTTKLTDGTVWYRMARNNNWVFATTGTIAASAVCGNESRQLTLRGSGMISLNSNCVLRNEKITIQGHFMAATEMHQSYASFELTTAFNSTIEKKTLYSKAELGRTHLAPRTPQKGRLGAPAFAVQQPTPSCSRICCSGAVNLLSSIIDLDIKIHPLQANTDNSSFYTDSSRCQTDHQA